MDGENFKFLKFSPSPITRGLSEYEKGIEKGYLIDTCLDAQEQYQVLIDKYVG